MHEQTAPGLEPHIDLAAARLRHLPTPELRVLDPLSRRVGLLRRIETRRPFWFISRRCGSLSNPAPGSSRRWRGGRVSLLVETVLAAARAADDAGGDAVRIQGDDLMRAFGFAPPAECVRVVARA